jgi:hypothetical protein
MWGIYATAVLVMPVNVKALGALSQAFPTDDTSLVAGTMVDLKSGSSSVVEKATSSRASQLLGVTASEPLVALGSGAHEAQVVVSGLTPTLVSNINGDIKVGDKITASPILGVGMKAVDSTEIVGTAESNLSASNTITRSITDMVGKTVQVKIGIVAVQVGVSYFAAPQNKLDAIVPTFLVNLGSSIAGKDVSPLRILIGFLSLLIGFLIAGVMLQAGVRSGIISLGRNPLASGILRRGLVDVLITSVGLMAITVIAFYLVLTS